MNTSTTSTKSMTTRRRDVAASPDHVWDVLADGWLFPLFVVGASRMRDVDDTWPAPGACLHHSVGAWPLLLDDTTEVIAADPGHRLELQARGWPAGEATVVFELEPHGLGTRVALSEDAVSGPGVLVPKLVRAPQIAWRNTETLRRFAFLVERRR